MQQRARGVWLLLLLSSFAWADPVSEAFSHAFRRHLQNPQHEYTPPQTAYRYVFIKGFMSEGTPGYFTENIAFLKRIGIKPARLHVLPPCSAQDVETNAERLHEQLRQLSALGREKLVLIAHSKGALESLVMTFKYPDFVRRHVKTLLMVQGAFGGSGVADFIHGEGRPVDDRMPLLHRILFMGAERTARLLDPWIHEGMASLTRRRAAELWERVQARPLPPDVKACLNFVGSTRDPNDMSDAVDCTGSYLQLYYGDNDGLVELRDQSLPDCGRILDPVSADHAGLTVAWPLSNMGREYREALMAGLLTLLRD